MGGGSQARGSILVVEKDPFYASFYERSLSVEGYRVSLAGGVEEGLRLFGERPYDVVISDMVLKGEDGLVLLRSLKEADPGQDVVMITSMQSIRKAVEALKLGASEYLTKPVDEEELLMVIRRLIERRNISDEHSRLVRENVLFFEQFRVQKRALEVLGMLDADRIMDHLLDMVAEETGAVGASLFLYSEIDGKFSFATGRGTFERDEDGGAGRFQKGALREEFFRGRAVLEDRGGGQHPETSLEAFHRFRLPLLKGGKLSGLLAVGPRRDDGAHGHYQVNIARVIAESGATALENARFFSLEASRELRDPHIETYSPAYFHQAALKEVNIARRYGRDLSVVCVEVEDFRPLKSKIKETQARRLLKEISVKLLEIARETDVLSMLEEGFFAIVVPETDFYGALMLIKRIKAALRSTVFALDLKRELKLSFAHGSATYPGDGEQLVTLLRTARERIASERGSLARRLKLPSRSFWKAYAHLVGLGSRADRDPEIRDSYLTLGTAELDHIRNVFLDEAGGLGGRRGLIYIGSQTVDATLFDYSGFSRLAGTKISVFTLGARGEGSWTHPEIMPVYLEDRDITAHRFMLCVAENFYYTLLCRPAGEDSWKAFHTSDPFITQEMVGKLQERYLLQQRIG